MHWIASIEKHTATEKLEKCIWHAANQFSIKSDLAFSPFAHTS